MSEIPPSESERHVIQIFRLSPKKWWNKRQLNARAVWVVPDHLACYWADLETLNSSDGTTQRLLEVRTESLLFVILAGEIPSDQWKPPEVRRAFQKTIHWNLRQQLLPQNQPDNSGRASSNIVDYVLWYGDPAELETNLIIMNSNFSEAQGSPLFHNLARIHAARKQAGRNSAIYGVMTDGRIWMFLFISHSSRYTKKVFHWDIERDQIIAQLWDIVKQAVTLFKTKVLPRSSLPSPTVQSLTGFRFEELPEENFWSDDHNIHKSSDDLINAARE